METQQEFVPELRELLAECLSVPDALLVEKTKQLKDKLNRYDRDTWIPWNEDLIPVVRCTSASTS